MKKSTKRELKRITDTIVRKYRPQKIILFGSYAWGRPTRASDADLFIVKQSKTPKRERITEVERLLYPAPFPLDVLVYTPAEVRKRLGMGDFFIRRIMRDGKLLYETR